MIDRRINWIDWAKTMGIIFVVFAHASETYGKDIIFLFHMPFFFMISGYLFHVRPIKEEIYRLAFYLFLPYLIYNLLLLILTPPGDILQSVKDIILGNQEQLPNNFRPMWFIISLLIMRVVSCMFPRRIIEIAIGCLCFVSFLRLWDMVPFDKDILQINTSMLSFHFFVTGYCIKKYQNRISQYINSSPSLFLLIVVILVLIFSVKLGLVNTAYGVVYGKGPVNVFRCMTGYNIFVFLFTSYAICSCLFVLIQRFLNRANIFIRNISNGTLLILCIHQTLIDYLVRYMDCNINDYSLLITLIVIALCYPLILLSDKFCPVFIGKRRSSKKQIINTTNHGDTK